MGNDDEADESVVVEGETRQAALEEGARQLGLHPDDVKATVITEGSSGIMGMFESPWELEVSPRPQRESLREATLEEAMKAAEAVDGSFQLSVEGRKIYLTVHPPSGTGNAVDPDEIIAHLHRIGLSYCDFDRVRSVVSTKKGHPERIGELPPGEDINAQYDVIVSDDKMTAELMIEPPKLGGDPPTLEEAERAIADAGVTEGINDQVVENMVETPRFNEAVTIAEGRPAEQGTDAKIEYHFNTDRKPEFDGEEQVDFRELDLINNVEEGDLLAEKTDPGSGRPGMTVTGEQVPAPDGEDKELEFGENVRKEGNRLFSTIVGEVILGENGVEVHEVHTVDGDVDYSTGNIEFQGTVVVEGSVRDRFRVKAAGNIMIEGSVGKAYLQADNDVIVGGGIRGKSGAQVNAGANIVSEFVERSGLIAQENVMVNEMILHSQVDAGESVFVNGSRGLIVGGHVRAGKTIFARELGSVGASETRVEVGVDPVFFREMAKVEKKILKQQEKLDKIERAINTLSGRDDLSEEDETKLRELEKNQENLTRNIENFREEQQTLARQAEEREGASVSVDGTVFGGTRVIIGNDIYTVHGGDIEHCTFKKLGNKIEVSRFQEPEVPEI